MHTKCVALYDLGAVSQKVLYVAGAGRSGSTIFGNVLGQLEGFASFGELYNFPLRFLEQRYCGCGVRLPECPFWRQVVQLCWHGDVEAQLRAWLAQRDEVARARHALRWRLSFARQKLLLKSSAYRVTLAQFYRALAQVSGARVLVDTSKVAGYAQVLAWTPGIELYVVHLVREPRAVAYSWARTKLKPTPAGSVAIAPTSPVHGALKWLAHNLATELYCTLPRLRYMRTRYEDFVRDPCQTIRAVLDFVGERSPIPVAVDNSIALTAQHTVDGNPDRFSKGLVVLSADDEWRHRLDWRARTLVTLIAAPLLHRYGYA